MDLTSHYLGLKLSSPVVASASPLSASLDGVRRLEDAGVGAIVLYSLFEEQLTLTREELTQFLAQGSSYSLALNAISDSHRLRHSPLDYLEHVGRAREAVDVPIIASINGSPHVGWTHYAKLLEQAGAAALEVNLYFVPTDIDIEGSDIERAYLDTLRSIVREVKLPVAVKMSPYFSNVANMAKRIADAGAQGLVLFNRFYQPDIDIDRRTVRPALELSTAHSLRLPLRWTAILHDRIDADIAITSGVHAPQDVVKAILAGADVAMVCSVLMKNGVDHVTTLNRGVQAWMIGEEVKNLDAVRGSMSQARYDTPATYERAQYIRTLESVF